MALTIVRHFRQCHPRDSNRWLANGIADQPLEFHNSKIRNSLEVTEVQRRNRVVEMARGSADEQIAKRELDSLRFLLPFDAAGESGDVKGRRIHGLPRTSTDMAGRRDLASRRIGAMRRASW